MVSSRLMFVSLRAILSTDVRKKNKSDETKEKMKPHRPHREMVHSGRALKTMQRITLFLAAPRRAACSDARKQEAVAVSTAAATSGGSGVREALLLLAPPGARNAVKCCENELL